VEVRSEDIRRLFIQYKKIRRDFMIVHCCCSYLCLQLSRRQTILEVLVFVHRFHNVVFLESVVLLLVH